MEESAIKRYRGRFHRLLTSGIVSLFLLFPVRFATAESTAQETPQVLVQLESSVLQLENPWKLTLLIHYPEPDKIHINLPPLSGVLVLDRIKTAIRTMEQEPWTAVEYVFIPKRLGSFTLGPLEIQIPGKRILTSPQALTVQDPLEAARTPIPRLYWSDSNEALRVGMPVTLDLHLEGSVPLTDLAQDLRTLSVQLVQNALVEPLSVHEKDRAAGIIYRIGLTPLQKGALLLPEASFTMGKQLIRSEPKQLIVSEGAPERIPAVQNNKDQLGEDQINNNQFNKNQTNKDAAGPLHTSEPQTAFPAFIPGFPWSVIWPLVSPSIRPVLQESKQAWEAGDPAKALSILRKKERDSTLGPFYRQIRASVETEAQLHTGPEEWWIPRGALYVLAGISLGLALIVGLFKRKRMGVLVLACSALILLYSVLGQSLLVPLIRGGTVAVIRETTAHTIPEASGSISTRFAGGEAVLIQHSTDTWAFIVASGQRSGWVLRSALVVY